MLERFEIKVNSQNFNIYGLERLAHPVCDMGSHDLLKAHIDWGLLLGVQEPNSPFIILLSQLNITSNTIKKKCIRVVYVEHLQDFPEMQLQYRPFSIMLKWKENPGFQEH